MLQIMHKGKWVPRLAGALDRKVHLSVADGGCEAGWKKPLVEDHKRHFGCDPSYMNV